MFLFLMHTTQASSIFIIRCRKLIHSKLPWREKLVDIDKETKICFYPKHSRFSCWIKHKLFPFRVHRECAHVILIHNLSALSFRIYALWVLQEPLDLSRYCPESIIQTEIYGNVEIFLVVCHSERWINIFLISFAQRTKTKNETEGEKGCWVNLISSHFAKSLISLITNSVDYFIRITDQHSEDSLVKSLIDYVSICGIIFYV